VRGEAIEAYIRTPQRATTIQNVELIDFSTVC